MAQMLFSSRVAHPVKTVKLSLHQAETGSKPDAEIIAAAQKATASIPDKLYAVSEEIARQQMEELMAKKPTDPAARSTPPSKP